MQSDNTKQKFILNLANNTIQLNNYKVIKNVFLECSVSMEHEIYLSIFKITVIRFCVKFNIHIYVQLCIFLFILEIDSNFYLN